MKNFSITPNYGVRVDGIEDTKRKLAKYSEENKKKLRDGMWTAGRFLLREAQKLVPVDTGALKASGKVLVRNNDDNHPEFHVSFGNDDDVHYAAVQHENLEYFHTIGQAKYLEQPA